MNKFKKLLYISLLISLLSVVVVLIFTVDSTTISAIMAIKHEYIIAAAALHAFSYLIWGLRTKFMCQALGYRVSILKSVEIITSSTLVAAITPASVGGEPVRIHLLHKNEMPVGHATAVVVGERVMDAILILSLVPFVFYIFRNVLSNHRLDTIFVIAEAISISAFVLIIYGMWKPQQIKRLIHFIVNKIAYISGKNTDVVLSKILTRVDSEFDNFHNSIRTFLTQGKKGLLYGAVCTILLWLVEYSILPVILMGLDQNPSIIMIFAAQVLLTIIMIMAATPGASGVAELGATTLLSAFVTPSIIGITVVAWRALTYYMNISVGGFVSVKILKDTDLISKLLGD
ncbi:MAG: lysylphosphatidylglycerol synthase transmembrane domain-containing protein [Methanosarcinaceae archaeon]